METKRYQRIEHDILKLALRDSGSDGLGYPTTLPALASILRQTFTDIADRELVDTLKRLQRRQCLTLCKWSEEHNRCLKYPAEISNDAEFFYAKDFRIGHTLDTDPCVQNLAAEISPQESRSPMTALGAESEGAELRKSVAATELTFIADSRLAELRKLVSVQFDFKKLVRLCQEINTAYSEECYFATAMLTRGLLDHVPPIFGKATFNEVANNYGGGGKSFKETMHHLENAARKVADAHLHMPIRKSETLPTAQQVNFASQLDVLLAEIIRIEQ